MLVSIFLLLTKASGMECIDLEYVMATLRADSKNICFRTMIFFFWKKIILIHDESIIVCLETESQNSAVSL